jgi:hypothetical protein
MATGKIGKETPSSGLSAGIAMSRPQCRVALSGTLQYNTWPRSRGHVVQPSVGMLDCTIWPRRHLLGNPDLLAREAISKLSPELAPKFLGEGDSALLAPFTLTCYPKPASFSLDSRWLENAP